MNNGVRVMPSGRAFIPPLGMPKNIEARRLDIGVAQIGGVPTAAWPLDKSLLTSLVAWWDCSDQASVMLQSTNLVNMVLDKSGYGNHLCRYGGSQVGPVYGSRFSMNGLRVMDFIPNDRIGAVAVTAFPDPVTVLLVICTDVQGNSVIRANPGPETGLRMLGSNWELSTPSGSDQLIATGLAAVVGQEIFLGYSREGTVGRVFVRDGFYQDNSYTQAAGTSANYLILGGRGVEGAGESYDGWIGEVFSWTRALSLQEVQHVRAYLQAKWGCN